MGSIKNFWFISREYRDLAGNGGLQDVCRQLALALAKKYRVTVCLPAYSFLDPLGLGFKAEETFQVDMNYTHEERREAVQIWSRTTEEGMRFFLFDACRYQEKRGIYTYTAEDEAEDPEHLQGTGHYDYFAMNVLLQKAAICLMIYRMEQPDIIHCHDGHTALVPAMIRENEGFRHFFSNTGCLVTIHNAGVGYHQEVDDLPFARAITGLPEMLINQSLLGGSFDPFLAAAPYALLNTVSENYAYELMETDYDEMTGWLGHALIRRGIRIRGITNGINPEDFNPENAKSLGIAAPYSPVKGNFSGKEKCKEDLINSIRKYREKDKVTVYGYLDLMMENSPLFTCISRLTPQKGIDRLVIAMDKLLVKQPDLQMLVMGTGDTEIEESLIRLIRQNSNKGRIALLKGYDERLANRVYAAGDFFLVPSIYEPCGLSDFIAQLFGNIPVVHHTGGLIKVIDGKTGFAYKQRGTEALMSAIIRASQVFKEDKKKIREIQINAVKILYENYTWDKVMQRYEELYGECLNK
ncbi:MAG: glycogen synthase [Thermodesulfobacteriota bacterium]